MAKKEKFAVMSLGKGNATAYDAAGENYHVPERFRTTIKVGDYVLIAKKDFEKSAKRDELGNFITDAAGNKVLEDKPFTRYDVTFVGTRTQMAIAEREEEILNATGDAIVKAEIERTLAAISKETVDVAKLEELSA